jgi:hypothetical protein
VRGPTLQGCHLAFLHLKPNPRSRCRAMQQPYHSGTDVLGAVAMLSDGLPGRRTFTLIPPRDD